KLRRAAGWVQAAHVVERSADALEQGRRARGQRALAPPSPPLATPHPHDLLDVAFEPRCHDDLDVLLAQRLWQTGCEALVQRIRLHEILHVRQVTGASPPHARGDLESDERVEGRVADASLADCEVGALRRGINNWAI